MSEQPEPEPIPPRWAHLPEADARRRMAQRARDRDAAETAELQDALQETYANDPNFWDKHDR